MVLLLLMGFGDFDLWGQVYGLDWRTPVLVLFCEKREQYVLRHWHGEGTRFLYIRDKQQRYILRRVFSEGISESELTTHIIVIVGRSVESVVVRDEWLLPNRNRTREWPWEQRIDLHTQRLAIVRVDMYKSIQGRMKTAFLEIQEYELSKYHPIELENLIQS